MPAPAELTLDAGDTRLSPPRQDRVESALVVALDCERPLGAASRHSLSGVDVVELGRGETGARRERTARGSTLALQLNDPVVSTRHARLERQLDNYFLEDAGSRNGTRVNGQKVERRLLEDGDVIEVGRTLLVFRARQRAGEAMPLDVVARVENAALPGVVTLEPGFSLALAQVGRLARSDLSMLLLGESGTGKEVVARAIHEASGRSGAFVAVNCGAIPENLVEAELFGWRKGAFSGAIADQPGLVRSAHQGTLFLDEIADLPLVSQAALLRVLQEREVRPVGGAGATPIDLRVVAATHQPLPELVERGRFREDLYSRIIGSLLKLPALRERPEDLGVLTGELLLRHAQSPSAVRFELAAARALFCYSWPRNIRELENALKAALVLSPDGVLRLQYFPDPLHVAEARPRTKSPPPEPEPPELDAAQLRHRAELVELFREHQGNVSAVARVTGKARNQIQRWMKRYAIDPAEYR
jgi:transcriptional regulator with PAS, ATPase and Fis domain